MRKIFGLLLLGLAFLAPDLAQAAARFAVCTTTCTWDNSSTAMWSTSSGGATGASAPTSADDVTFDANTCVGGTTCTITTFAGTISVSTISFSACTASTTGCILDASANNTNFTISGTNAFSSTGSGTRTLNMGNGTWTISGSGATWTFNGNSNFTLNANGSTLAFTATGAGSRTMHLGGGGAAKTLNTVTVAASTTGQWTYAGGGSTVTTLTISAPNRIYVQDNQTNTVTTLTPVVASSTQQILFASGNQTFGTGRWNISNAWTCQWCAFLYFERFGTGSATATDSFNLGGNTGVTITAPASGGGGGRIIGG